MEADPINVANSPRDDPAEKETVEVEEESGGEEGQKKWGRGRRVSGLGRRLSFGDGSEGEGTSKELSTPLLNRPLREKKPVDWFVASAANEVAIEQGNGTPLKDIPNVAYKLSKRRKTEKILKVLHAILYGKLAQEVLMKRNILKFSGFVWDEKKGMLKRKLKDRLEKYNKRVLLKLCDVLDIHVSKIGIEKKELVVKLIKFLESPCVVTDVLIEEDEQKLEVKKRKREGKGIARKVLRSPQKNDKTTDSDKDWDSSDDSDEDIEDEVEYEQKDARGRVRTKTAHTAKTPCTPKAPPPIMAANVQRGHAIGPGRVGTKTIPKSIKCGRQTNLDRAKSALTLAASPGSLPCRNKEIEEIMGFVTGALAAGDQCLGRCLYIHGVPGTGKTATVLTVMKKLQAKVDAERIQPYQFVEINGLKLVSPENLYKVLYEALTGHRVGWKRALYLLNQRFSESKSTSKDGHYPCVLLVDELDLLVTRNQSVLYNVFDWPTRAHSQLIVIGIANTMDLPEKLLPRIASRMGMQRLCFGPYSHQQLQEIISSRLKGIEAFEKQAVEFASRKVAAVSGDARRALELCRSAAELAQLRLKQSSFSLKNETGGSNANSVKNLVGMVDIEAAIHEMFQAPHIQMIRRCSRLAKIFLVAMVHEYHKTGMSETTFEKLAICILFLCTSNGEQCPDWDSLFSVGCRLGACRILLCEPGFRHRLQKLQLNFPSDDVSFALKNDKDLLWSSKYL